MPAPAEEAGTNGETAPAGFAVDHDEEAEPAPAAPAAAIRRRHRVNPDGSVSELELPGSEPAVPPVPKPDTGAAEDPPDTILSLIHI